MSCCNSEVIKFHASDFGTPNLCKVSNSGVKLCINWIYGCHKKKITKNIIGFKFNVICGIVCCFLIKTKDSNFCSKQHNMCKGSWYINDKNNNIVNEFNIITEIRFKILSKNSMNSIICPPIPPSQVVVITQSSNFLIPDNINTLLIFLVGGGGGGGGSRLINSPGNTVVNGGGGGGGGGFVSTTVSKAVAGSALNIQMGKGGLGGPTGIFGQDGSDTTVSGNIVGFSAVANGGKGGEPGLVRSGGFGGVGGSGSSTSNFSVFMGRGGTNGGRAIVPLPLTRAPGGLSGVNITTLPANVGNGGDGGGSPGGGQTETGGKGFDGIVVITLIP